MQIKIFHKEDLKEGLYVVLWGCDIMYILQEILYS